MNDQPTNGHPSRDEMIRITRVSPKAVDLPRPDWDMTEYQRRPQVLPERPVELSTWEQIQIRIDATLQAAKLVAIATPHVINILIGVFMNSTAKIATAAVALIIAVLGHFGILVPESLIPVVDGAVLFIVGWFIKAPGQTKKTDGE